MTRALLLTLLLVACVAPIQHRGEVNAGEISWRCDERHPWIALRGDAVCNDWLIEHERAHIRQAYRLGCQGWNEALQDSARLADLEAEAVRDAYEVARNTNPRDC